MKPLDPDRKPDRRQQKTRKVLHEALLALIQEKGYAAITLQDITDRANVARTTFYLHFKDKDDLLFQGVRDMYDELMHEYMARAAQAPNSELAHLEHSNDFKHVEKYADFYRAMTSADGSAAFIVNVFDYLAFLMNSPDFSALHTNETQFDSSKMRVPDSMLAYAMAGAEIGVVMWWLHHNKLQMPAETLSKLFYMTMVYGANWATGTDNKDLPSIETDDTPHKEVHDDKLEGVPPSNASNSRPSHQG